VAINKAAIFREMWLRRRLLLSWLELLLLPAIVNEVKKTFVVMATATQSHAIEVMKLEQSSSSVMWGLLSPL
jgi:hypothetical protein